MPSNGHRIELVVLPNAYSPDMHWNSEITVPSEFALLPSPIRPDSSPVSLEPNAVIRWITGFYNQNIDSVVAEDAGGELSSGGWHYKTGISNPSVFVPGTASEGTRIEFDVTDIVKQTVDNTIGNPEASLNLMLKGAWNQILNNGIPTPFGYYGFEGESESFFVPTQLGTAANSPASLSFYSMNAAQNSFLIEQAIIETRKSLGTVETNLAVPPLSAFSSSTISSNQYFTIPISEENGMTTFLHDIKPGDQIEIRNSTATIVSSGRSLMVSANGTHTYFGYVNGRLLLQPGTSGAIFKFVNGPNIGSPYNGFVMQNQFTSVPIFSRSTDPSQGNQNIIVNTVTQGINGSTSFLEKKIQTGSILFMHSQSNTKFLTVIGTDYSNPSQEIIFVKEDLVLENSNESGELVSFAILDDIPRLEIEYYEN